jgi:hypothetical protein
MISAACPNIFDHKEDKRSIYLGWYSLLMFIVIAFCDNKVQPNNGT